VPGVCWSSLRTTGFEFAEPPSRPAFHPITHHTTQPGTYHIIRRNGFRDPSRRVAAV